MTATPLEPRQSPTTGERTDARDTRGDDVTHALRTARRLTAFARRDPERASILKRVHLDTGEVVAAGGEAVDPETGAKVAVDALLPELLREIALTWAKPAQKAAWARWGTDPLEHGRRLLEQAETSFDEQPDPNDTGGRAF